jgi:pimeloyl-ACP methyl ester carboxylesterase
MYSSVDEHCHCEPIHEGKVLNLEYSLLPLYKHLIDYNIDFGQRAVIFTDILRQRGNNYLDHLKQGQPPVLAFDYEVIMDGREMSQPVNYALVRILDRRSSEPQTRHKKKATGILERRTTVGRVEPHPRKRPIVVIDPRAGHGPGIAGSKLDSQIGVALNSGHPVYFILFFTEPEPDQTIARVQHAEVQFLEEVARRHPQADKPAVIGNCQAGWAAALIGADRPDIIGPMVFNGSPLSYWGGIEGANPMRYRGGLVGGVWLTSLWCDLGNGKFDGAHLVAGFEDLNPANTIWQKQYHVWSNVDTEGQRYLDFEKWWGGFFKMNREEIHYIVDSLFVGNELESGHLQLGHDKVINLKKIQDPIVVFASKGDNITPPQQALNWIVKVYGSVDEIKRHGHVIVYLLHEHIGHLGIFVSSSVAEREHKEIIASVEAINYLAPGLYEMVIEAPPSKAWLFDHKVAFIERDMKDILALDDGLDDEAAFVPVAAFSRFNDKLYQTFLSPVVQAFVNEFTAEWIRQLHPLRIQRYSISDLNPWLWPAGILAPMVKSKRRSITADNPLVVIEKAASESINIALEYYRQMRDASQEFVFNMFYANPWIQALFGGLKPSDSMDYMNPEADDGIHQELWHETMKRGGFRAAVIRIILAVMGANRRFDRIQFHVAGKLLKANERFKDVSAAVLKQIGKKQAACLNRNINMALETLADLLPHQDERIEAFEIANSIAASDLLLEAEEEKMLQRIKTILDL